jgi:hypothetical protein
MAYTTQAQVENAAGSPERLVQICDDGAGALSATKLAQAQLTADMLIDGHSRMRYASLAGTDTAIALAAAETVYQLKCAIGQNSTNDDNLAAARLELYKAIAEGSFRPDEPLPAPSTAIKSAWVERDITGTGISRKGFSGGPFGSSEDA